MVEPCESPTSGCLSLSGLRPAHSLSRFSWRRPSRTCLPSRCVPMAHASGASGWSL